MQEGVTPRKRHRTAYMRGYRAKRSAEREGFGLLPYQREFLAAVTRRDNRPELSAISVARGNGKTYLAGALLAKALKPSDDPLYRRGGRIGTCLGEPSDGGTDAWRPHGWF